MPSRFDYRCPICQREFLNVKGPFVNPPELSCPDDLFPLQRIMTYRPGQSHLIFGTGSTCCVITTRISKLCCINALYKALENLDAIALTYRQEMMINYGWRGEGYYPTQEESDIAKFQFTHLNDH